MRTIKQKWTGIFSRYQNKIGMLAFISLLIGLSLTVCISYYGIKSLSGDSAREIEKGLNDISKEYMNNYINITKVMVESKIQIFFDEQATLADTYQKFIDNDKEFEPLVKSMTEMPFFKDNLKFSGRWYQNDKSEPTVLLVQRYLLDKQNNIRPEVMKAINQSAVLDWLMPSAYKHGAKELWVYYQGGRESSFMRIAPWNDAGTELDKIYPKFTDEENWEAFNPGLVGAWEKRISENDEYKKDLSSLAIVKSPTQDGGSGKIIMTLDHPIWDQSRSKFMGAICVDVELSEIISYIEDVKLADTGFAYISQSNGNVFAINDRGTKILGLKSTEDATIKGNNGIGFNPMKRFLASSTIENVRKIKLPTGEEISTEGISINGKDYIIVQKNLKPLNTWTKEKGFCKETWTLGFVVPKDEMFSTLFTAKERIDQNKTRIIALQLIIAILTILVISIGIYLITGRITRNLRRLETAAVEIMNRNYEVSVDVQSTDEIGKLGTTINNMISEIKGTFQQLSVQNELLKNEIEERQEKERKIRYLEDYDTLTGLPKQNLLISKIEEKIHGEEKPSNLITIIIGIDNFRKVNEVFGHIGGNEVLKAVAYRLMAIVADSGMVARVNGDEFAITYSSIGSLEETAHMVEDIIKTIKTGYRIDGKDVYITACAGISSYPADSSNAAELMQYAASALLHAKEKGPGNYCFYDVEINKVAQNRINMISELGNAIDADQLELNYQPLYNLQDKTCIGVEALLRWNNPVFGRVMPAVFIPLAEENGMIVRIGEWVLKTACRQVKHWHDMGYGNLFVAVNLSPKQFNDEHLVDNIKSIITESNLPPSFVELEVTEGLFIHELNNAVAKLNELRRFGVKIAVDDFGTGYSSLSYIKDLPIDKLKIDRNFIKDIPQNDRGEIANIIINLAKSLGIRVTAEGVETAEQEKFLEVKMCREVQGYYYSKPLDVDSMTKLLEP